MAIDLVNIEQRLKSGQAVTDTEKVALIKGNEYALAAFMIDNNPGNVNQTLRKMGFNHLTFFPDKTALKRQLQIFIDRGDSTSFNDVASHFNINQTGLSNEFINAYNKI